MAAREDTAAPRVLVVDDNALNIELARCLLEVDGWEVLCIEQAERVPAVLREFSPDVVLMDVQMPGTDGLELTRQIRADPATRALVVVAFTAYAMKGDEQRMLEAGCDGYISKPIDAATFAQTVRSHLPPQRRAGL